MIKKERFANLVDFSCPFDSNVMHKEIEKVEKYQDLLLEIQRLWNVKVEVIPIILGALGALSPSLKAGYRDFTSSCTLVFYRKLFC